MERLQIYDPSNVAGPHPHFNVKGFRRDRHFRRTASLRMLLFFLPIFSSIHIALCAVLPTTPANARPLVNKLKKKKRSQANDQRRGPC